MNKYGLHGNLKAAKGSGGKLLEIMLKAANLMATAKGCYLYLVSLDKTDNDLIWITEVWETKEDHANSLSVDGVRDLISDAIPLLSESPKKGLELIVKGGI